jgi:hypothetical protein
MLTRLSPKRAPQLARLSRFLSTRVSFVGPRLVKPFEPLAELNHHRGGTQVRFYAQQPPNGGGFPGFSFQQQRNKGDALKEFVGSPSVYFMTAGDADNGVECRSH